MNRVDRTPVDLRLYAIVGLPDTDGRDLVDLVGRAVAGGATLVQLREKQADTRRLVELARALAKTLAGTGVPLLVNDRVDVALAAQVDGVHLGQSDMDPHDARRLLGPDAIIGWTLKTPVHARALADVPVDYGCIGGVFATTSKDNPEPPIGLAGLAETVAAGRAAVPGMPLGAIAGIDETNARAVIGSGADGIAVISAIFRRKDPTASARGLRRLVDEALAARGA
ncbi:thiamine phosphate synthase [Salinarimonas ramus]|uniref:Thiamine-phosphate synthase n=1 Tax=Salinarimonas ramus TaxID=690164 RepID=A0A917Q5U2_9HYPH|nr:thiamine phosphate synthase [Salinarimonas ramus]GGK19610.1 thiamine-phosphate synthase [Salinarimonas ramus]